MKLYREVKASKGKYALSPVDPENTESILTFVEPIDITEEDHKSLYKVIKIAEEDRLSWGIDDDPDVFNVYMLLRKLTGIEDDLSKLKGK